MSGFALEVRGLSKSYGKIRALKKVSFSIKKGTITSFLGENGAGKTTAIKCCLGFLKKDSGSIEMERGRVGYVPEYPVFFDWLKGREILFSTSRLFDIPGEKVRALIEEFSARIGFDPGLLERKVHTYSLGNRKKFSYLQSLIISPRFFVVDEPLYSLDPPSIKKIRELFLELKKKGTTVFLSSHIISEVEKITDDIIIIRKGEVVIQRNLSELKERFILFRVGKSGGEMEDLSRFSPYVRERDECVEVLLERSRLEAFASSAGGKKEFSAGEELDLEKLFLFFTG